jgi:hypothetical protein
MSKKLISEAAALIGRRGGLANSAKQAAARAKNGRRGGRPRQLPRGLSRVQYWHLANIANQGGKARTERQQEVLDQVAALRRKEKQ